MQLYNNHSQIFKTFYFCLFLTIPFHCFTILSLLFLSHQHFTLTNILSRALSTSFTISRGSSFDSAIYIVSSPYYTFLISQSLPFSSLFHSSPCCRLIRPFNLFNQTIYKKSQRRTTGALHNPLLTLSLPHNIHPLPFHSSCILYSCHAESSHP